MTIGKSLLARVALSAAMVSGIVGCGYEGGGPGTGVERKFWQYGETGEPEGPGTKVALYKVFENGMNIAIWRDNNNNGIADNDDWYERTESYTPDDNMCIFYVPTPGENNGLVMKLADTGKVVWASSKSFVPPNIPKNNVLQNAVYIKRDLMRYIPPNYQTETTKFLFEAHNDSGVRFTRNFTMDFTNKNHKN